MKSPNFTLSDNEKPHANFVEKYNILFLLLSNASVDTINKYCAEKCNKLQKDCVGYIL